MGVCKLLTTTLKPCLSGTCLFGTPVCPQWQPNKLRNVGDDYKTLFAASLCKVTVLTALTERGATK